MDINVLLQSPNPLLNRSGKGEGGGMEPLGVPSHPFLLHLPALAMPEQAAVAGETFKNISQ